MHVLYYNNGKMLTLQVGMSLILESLKLGGRSHNITGLNAMLIPLLLEVYHNLGLVLFFEILIGSSSLQLMD